MTVAVDPDRSVGSVSSRHRGRVSAWSDVDVHRRVDAGLRLLLAIQALTIFVLVPLSVNHPEGRLLLAAGNVAYTAVCIAVLARRRCVKIALVLAVVALLGAPLLAGSDATSASYLFALLEILAGVAFALNATVTTIVALHVFGPGRVTTHRIQGAILIYLDVATLFSIVYLAILAADPHGLAPASGGTLAEGIGARVAAVAYFSLTTVTTTGYGDIVPLHPLARSLSNLESVFGHLFPATMLARLVALNVAHGGSIARPPPTASMPSSDRPDTAPPPIRPFDG